MGYQVGKSQIKKHSYHVYIRNHQTAEEVETLLQLRALTNNLSGFSNILLDHLDTGADVTAKNTLYLLDGDSGNIQLDLDLNAITGEVVRDIIIFELTTTGAYTHWVKDENDVQVDLVNVGDRIVFKYSGTLWESYFQSANGLDSKNYYIEIGYLDEKPALKTSEGEERNVNVSDSIQVSENLEFTASDLQVSKDNYEYLRTLVATANCDVMFYDPKDEEDTVFTEELSLSAFLEAIGNDVNIVNLTGKKEVGDADDYFDFFDLYVP